MLAHGERRVEQQHALARPVAEVSRGGHVAPKVRHELLVDVSQARRQLAPRHGPRTTVPWPARPMVGVLPEDNDANVCRPRPGKRVQDVVLRRVDRLLGAHGLYLGEQLVACLAHLRGRIVEPSADVLVLYGHGASLRQWSSIAKGGRLRIHGWHTCDGYKRCVVGRRAPRARGGLGPAGEEGSHHVHGSKVHERRGWHVLWSQPGLELRLWRTSPHHAQGLPCELPVPR